MSPYSRPSERLWNRQSGCRPRRWRHWHEGCRLRRFGPPEVLEIAEVEKPAVPDDGVLVRVHASSVNPADFFSLSRVKYVARMLAGRLRPGPEMIGLDFAGTVPAVL